MLTQAEVKELRRDFPILQTKVKGHDLIYLDNAATTQKPQQVLERINKYYLEENANPHRGAHYLANTATEAYTAARLKVAKLIHAYRLNEIVFTKSATESLNLLAYTLGQGLKAGDEILISILEHHANLIPWQFVAKMTGAKLRYLYLSPELEISEQELKEKLSSKTKILALTGCSNVTGTRANLNQYFKLAKDFGALTVADLTQLVPHGPCDVREIGCDFAVFSGHKMYGPMGAGVLWGKYDLLAKLPPFHYGGDMIERVSEQDAVFAPPASRFEAGTMNVAAAVGLATAIDYLQAIGMAEVDAYEQALTELAIEGLSKVPDIELYAVRARAGEPVHRGAVLAFNVRDVHPHDVATILNESGIAIRSGHHCAEPLHRYLGINATCRASFSFYNTEAEVEQLIQALSKVRQQMGLS
ncbi:MAG: SufS family cysteine desulfurase [Eubacteriales bacterium]|nr:SufS family cysteine desulfurase [Eubacteriales bacterium]